MPNRDGLLHISEISWNRLENMESSGLKEGDTVEVKLIEIDKKTGKYRLSMRALQPKPEGYVERERAPRGDRPRREGGDRPRREGGDRACTAPLIRSLQSALTPEAGKPERQK